MPGNETTEKPQRSSITNCVFVADFNGPPLFSEGGDVCVQLDNYAIIPRSLFEAMGGDQHPAYLEWCRRYFDEYYTPDRIASMTASREKSDEE